MPVEGADATAQTQTAATAPGDNGWFDEQAGGGGGDAAAAAGHESGDTAVASPNTEDTYAGEGEAAMTAAAEAAAEEPPAPVVPERPPFHATLADMCDQIGKVYASQNLMVPPPVQRLTAYVDAGEYAQVKSQLTTIWNQLIQYHKESKLPFAVKTTQMFQSIQRTLASNASAAAAS